MTPLGIFEMVVISSTVATVIFTFNNLNFQNKT